MNIKCLFGFHHWELTGNTGWEGEHILNMSHICSRCSKIRKIPKKYIGIKTKPMTNAEYDKYHYLKCSDRINK